MATAPTPQTNVISEKVTWLTENPRQQRLPQASLQKKKKKKKKKKTDKHFLIFLIFYFII